MYVGNSIKRERKKLKLTQKDLAKKINKSERMLQKYENGEVTPSIEVLKEIANALNVPMGKLFGIDEIDLSQIPTNLLIEELNSRDDFPIKIEVKS